MGIEVRINKKIILNLLSVTVNSSISALSNAFAVTVSVGKTTVVGRSNLDFKPGEEAVITINDSPVVNGFVDEVNVFYLKDGHEIQLRGRSRTADFIDSSVAEVDIETQSGIDFDKLLRQVLDGMGLNDIQIINLLPTSADIKIREVKNISSEIGQSGFDFIDPFARLKKILLSDDGNGNILMTQGSGNPIRDIALINVSGTEKSNIISGRFSYSHTNRFNKYSVRSQEDFSAPDFDLDPADSVDNSGEATDPNIRSTRRFTFESEENSTSKECADRAAWESNLRAAQSVTFIALVLGHTVQQTDSFGTSSLLWGVNSKIRVVDIFSNINSFMLIQSIEFQFSLASGSRTEITLVPPDSYAIQASRDAKDAALFLIGKPDE